MKTSEDGINLIRQFEGLRLRAYVCPAGVVTIGYGTTLIDGERIKLTTVCTEEQALQYLHKDLEKFEDAVNELVKASISQKQFDALVCFVYNVGISAFKNSTLLKLLNAKKYVEAQQQFVRWNKANGKELPGLTKRRRAEADLFSSGIVTRGKQEKII